MVDTIKGVMVKKVITCNVNETLQSVAKVMRKKKIGCVIVINGKNTIGIVTERDMAYRGVANNLDSSKVKVKEVMTSPLKSISPDSYVQSANILMEKNKIKRIRNSG